MTDVEAILDDAGEQEAAILAEAKLAVRAAVDAGLEGIRPRLAQLHRDSTARFWNMLAGEMETVTGTIKADREPFEPLWDDLATELEHLAALKQRILAIRAQGDQNVH
ncbi:hypothetical protein BH23CHL7_BH23CHL7_08270 [soil metagenome]